MSIVSSDELAHIFTPALITADSIPRHTNHALPPQLPAGLPRPRQILPPRLSASKPHANLCNRQRIRRFVSPFLLPPKPPKPPQANSKPLMRPPHSRSLNPAATPAKPSSRPRLPHLLPPLRLPPLPHHHHPTHPPPQHSLRRPPPPPRILRSPHPRQPLPLPPPHPRRFAPF